MEPLACQPGAAYRPSREGATRMVETVQCPGCRRAVDVARPPGVNFEILPTQDLDARMVTIVIGCVVVHRCRCCPDGEWR